MTLKINELQRIKDSMSNEIQSNKLVIKKKELQIQQIIKGNEKILNEQKNNTNKIRIKYE